MKAKIKFQIEKGLSLDCRHKEFSIELHVISQKITTETTSLVSRSSTKRVHDHNRITI